MRKVPKMISKINNPLPTVRPRIVVFAYSEPGYTCLNELIKAHANIVAVYTHQDDPDEEIWFHSVYDLAKAHNINVYRPAKIDAKIAADIKKLQPELIFSFYFRRLIPDDIIAMPRLGSYNLHGALLPKYRGQTCINWAVVNGETRTGATLHQMTDKADEGDIVDQRGFDIAFTDKAIDVFKKVSIIAAEIVRDNLAALENGTAKLTVQDNSKATKYPRRRPKDGLLDFNRSARELYNLIRGVTHPFPGAFTFVNGRKLFIWWALPQPDNRKNTKDADEIKRTIGKIICTNPLSVGTADGILELKQLQWENDAQHSAQEFIDALPVGTEFCNKE